MKRRGEKGLRREGVEERSTVNGSETVIVTDVVNVLKMIRMIMETRKFE